MMSVVRKVDGEWQVLSGEVRLTYMATTAVLHFQGKREDETVSVDPYGVETALMDTRKIAQMFELGVWGDHEKSKYGLALARPFEVPEGMRRVGELSIVEIDGVPAEHYEIEDLPPPPPPPTAEEKLANAGLSEDELDKVIAASMKRQAKA